MINQSLKISSLNNTNASQNLERDEKRFNSIMSLLHLIQLVFANKKFTFEFKKTAVELVLLILYFQIIITQPFYVCPKSNVEKECLNGKKVAPRRTSVYACIFVLLFDTAAMYYTSHICNLLQLKPVFSKQTKKSDFFNTFKSTFFIYLSLMCKLKCITTSNLSEMS